MEKNTYLANTVENTIYQSKYDAEAKRLLADKQVLAWIMKYTTKEFKDLDIEKIIECIEGVPEIAQISIHSGNLKKQKITGLSTESKIPDEGKVTFDIRFYAVTPDEVQVRIFLNVEAQKRYHVGYGFVPRGVFYCARMISEQMDTEFDTESYDEMKKVYSIWICMESPEKVANTITEYSLSPKDIYGEFKEEEKYDLLSVIMVRLSGKERGEAGNQLIQMLTTLLSHKLDVEEKKNRLEKRYGMAMTETIEGGIRSMCNLGELVAEWGIEKGMAEGVAQGMAQGIVQGESRGEKIAQCNAIRNLRERMDVNEIADVMKYEKSFVETVIRLIMQYPDASDKEIIEML